MNEDHIWEMYYSDAYQASTRQACRDRVAWFEDHVRGRVLDVGCSQGVLPILLGRAGVDVVGVDIEEPAIAFARARLAEEPAEVQGRVEFVCADVQTWTPPAKFDTVTLGEVLEHVVEPARLIAALRALVIDGGRLLMTVPLGWLEHHDHKHAFLPHDLFALLEPAFGVLDCEIVDEKIRVIAGAGVATRAEAVDPARLLPEVGAVLIAAQHEAVADAARMAERREAMRAAMQRRIDHLTDHNADLESNLSRLRAGIAKADARVAKFAARAAELKRKLDAAVAAKARVKATGRYQLGDLLVKVGKRPSRIIHLPRKLTKLVAEQWKLRGQPLGAGPSTPAARAAAAPQVYDGTFRVSVPNARPFAPASDDRVLHLLEYSLPHMQNGYTLRSFQVVRAQKQHGWNPVVVTKPGFPEGPAVNGPELVADVPHYRLPPAAGTDVTAHLETYVTAASRVLEEVRPSLVQAGSNFRNAYAAMELARTYKLPFVYEVRGLWEETRIANGSLEREDDQFARLLAVETHCMTAADAIVTLGSSLKAELVRRGVDESKIFLVPNAVDAVQARAPRTDLRDALGLSGRFVASYLGSVSPLESLHVLVEAIRLLRRTRRDIVALIVGAGADLERLRQLAEDRGLEDAVRFVGSVPHDEVADYYALTDVVVCTRGRDRVCEVVTPLKPYEAMAYGKPVIVSDIPALREMVQDGVTGLLVPPEEPAALARALAELADNPERRAELAAQAHAWVREHRTWMRVAEGYRPAYAHARAAFARRVGSA